VHRAVKSKFKNHSVSRLSETDALTDKHSHGQTLPTVLPFRLTRSTASSFVDAEGPRDAFCHS